MPEEPRMSDVAKTRSVRHLLRVSEQATIDVVPDTAGTVRRRWPACLTPHSTRRAPFESTRAGV